MTRPNTNDKLVKSGLNANNQTETLKDLQSYDLGPLHPLSICFELHAESLTRYVDRSKHNTTNKHVGLV
jgi:hypothetical protein